MNFYLDNFLTFFKIGSFTFGGGYAMIPLIQQEIVDKKKWLKKDEFLDILAVAQSAPGVMAVNISIIVGYKLRGIRGSLTSALGAVLPSFIIILLIASFFMQFKDNPDVERVFKGIRPVVVALIFVPVFSMAKDAKISYKTVIIPVATALLIWLLNVSPIYIILIAAFCGIIYGWFKRR